jgi:prevent-host-death family protein
MSQIGVRELKTRASEIVRQVKEQGARYLVTHRGRPVAAIIPLSEAPDAAEPAGVAWDELVSLGEQIAHNWNSDKTSAEILSDMRR